MIRKSLSKETTAIKICGITKTSEAKSIAQLNIDAIGVIGVKKSPRFVSEQDCMRIFNEVEKVSIKRERFHNGEWITSEEVMQRDSSGPREAARPSGWC